MPSVFVYIRLIGIFIAYKYFWWKIYCQWVGVSLFFQFLGPLLYTLVPSFKVKARAREEIRRYCWVRIELLKLVLCWFTAGNLQVLHFIRLFFCTKIGTVSSFLIASEHCLRSLLISAILFYQKKISKKSRGKCKFYPTCSSYALTAVSRFGSFKGSLLSILRLLRCNEFSHGGVDFVPEVKKRENWIKHERLRLV